MVIRVTFSVGYVPEEKRVQMNYHAHYDRH